MGHTLQIGQTCCYWSANASKPLPAICIDCDEDSLATLQVFTAAGGRFTKICKPRDSVTNEGWGEVGQFFH